MAWLVHSYMSAQAQVPFDAEPANYLPFSHLLLNPEEEPLLEPKTKEILMHLLKSLQIPPHIYKILANPPSSKKA